MLKVAATLIVLSVLSGLTFAAMHSPQPASFAQQQNKSEGHANSKNHKPILVAEAMAPNHLYKGSTTLRTSYNSLISFTAKTTTQTPSFLNEVQIRLWQRSYEKRCVERYGKKSRCKKTNLIWRGTLKRFKAYGFSKPLVKNRSRTFILRSWLNDDISNAYQGSKAKMNIVWTVKQNRFR